MNGTFRIAFRAMVVAVMTLLTGSAAMAQTSTGPTIHGNVYGGGNLAEVKGHVTVNIKAGTVENDVYGGGALANTNTEANSITGGGDEKVYPTTVNLTGGTIGNAYGGGLGQKNGINGATEDKPAYVYGDVLVNVNGTKFTQTFDTYQEGTGEGATTVQVPKTGRVFGCNNLNGSPKKTVTVHVHKTVRLDGGAHTAGEYEIAAVYGGGNEAAYEPTISGEETAENYVHTNVIIDGCDLTSIKQVYGGGNAASTPATLVTINGAFEIDEVFGGGNGNDKIKRQSGTDVSWLTNPGANVGFYAYDADSEAFDTPEERLTKKYGFGKAHVNIGGGIIHYVYGGSNAKGNVREVAVAMLERTIEDNCFKVDEAYGGGKAAPMDGSAELNLGCIPGVGTVYGGARAATVNNNVVLTITNGTFNKVFGGNNEAGTINGTITLNIEETGCTPIVIGQLYGGGNLAAYTAPTGENGPTLNIKSFTSIGEVYGGGYSADVTGNVHVNINEVVGKQAATVNGYPKDAQNQDITSLDGVAIPTHTKDAIGAIRVVYGGGYGADVIGDVEVNIGTAETIDYVSMASGETEPRTGITVEGANITGSIYGGGYGAATTVTGDVKVNVGGQKDDGTFVGGNIIIAGSVYGGSALGAVNATKGESGLSPNSGKTTEVTLKKGTVTRYVFGGGQGNANTTAHVYGNSTVTLYGDVVAGGLYGGCDANGKMHGDTKLNLIGGTIGASSAPTANILFGGGLGQATTVDGDVTVNVGSYSTEFASYSGNPVTIWGNVYGGGALGSVNTNTNNTTLVNLYKGTVKGNVFGGGLGQAAAEAQAAVPYTSVDEYNADKGTSLTADEFNALTDEQKIKTPAVAAKDAIAAAVNGNIRVDLNGYNGMNINSDDAFGTCVVTGSIFGCNNTQGSPSGDVEVHIYKTVGTGTNVRSPDKDNTKYDLSAVYGGGNKASYTTTGKTANVIIETCNVSIKDVYGGGYGADVPNTQVEVKGAYEIGTVFGGGYGAGSDDPTAADYNPGANVNGTDGTTTVLLKGGTIHEAYGGSNTKGDVTGGTNVNVSDNGNTSCPLKVEQIYGGGKNAQMTGGTNIILGCQPDDWIKEIYAGAQAADVGGSVGLTITSGKFERVFGGNKTSGKIKGSITVNIEETGTCATPIIIGELYGGGYQAGYSIYGYNNDNTPRTKAQYDTWYAGLSDEEKAKPENKPYSNPQLNVRSFTSIGAIYGGGYEALMVADPTVSINVVKGSHADDNDLAAGSTQPNSLPYPAHKKGAIGTIGNVFGGGNLATVDGSATVNIGTEETVKLTSIVDDPNTTDVDESLPTVEGANITGNVYGGGNLADVTGNTQVNICAKEVTSGTTTSWQSVAYGTGLTGVTIGSAGVNDKDHGHVFGGGKGVADNFTCDKAMVGTEDAGMVAGYLYGNTGVTIGNGTIYGNVYGGGEVGRVEMNTTVKIGIDDGSAPVIEGSVYGAGQGVDTHGYSGLARGNSRVTIDGEAWVKGSVYGGGEKASVGRYWVNGAPDPNHEAPTVPSGLPEGMPYALKDPNSGKCYVTIQGHAKIGPATLTMPTFLGNVFGGCKGILPGAYSYADNTTKPKRWVGNDWSYFANEAAYIQFIRTLAMNNETHVTIDENAFVKGSVYGGSENGGVLDNTYVTIAGGQIGCGEGYDAPYTDWSAASLPECPHWTYGIDTNNDNKKDLFAPYDKFAKEDGTYDYTDIALPSTEQQVSSSEGGRPASKASDGHTFYGNVFGGGSGKDPYKPGKWLMTAGGVGGYTNVTITGGHILTSVYGGNELTNVGEELVNDETKNKGKCIIRMSGGSIGVPRTLQQILDHPVTCNLFGAGKGDQRVLFNKWTNVNDVDIQITGGTIYGSVFGGGEDGHVMRDVKLEIGQASGKTTMIGTLGTSGFEGNVFGGGRGFGGDAYTAGNVAGSVDLDITGGTMLGSVYGGGRLASVGYGLYDKGVSGYGEIREDNKNDNGDVVTYFTTTSRMNKLGRGHINIDISGGTIGNTSEFVYPTAAQKADDGDLRNTSYDQTTNRLLHTKGGNVFAGGMGRRTLLSGDPITADIIDWHKLGNAKSTKLTIRQASENVATIIRGNVYGGGELGTVLGNHQLYNGTTAVVDANNIPVMAGTEIVISGGTIGTQVAAKTGDGGGDAYYFGSVYGGGMGEIYEEGTGSSATTVLAGGNVNDSTKVSMSNGSVRGSVYGGGELGQVFGSADVAVSGGSIGVSGFGGAEYGNIYGGGKGSTEKLDAGLIKTNTWVTVSGSPQIWHNIYGGGAYGSVGTITRGSDATYIHVPGQTSVPDMPKSWAENTGSALVRILSGTIGRNGNENGMVFGSSRGDVGAPGEIHDKLAWVKKAKVVIGATGTTGPNIKGSVYGSGENGHLFQDAVVEIHSGVVGIAEGEPIGSYTAGGASYPYRGNVFGGGCGTDKYYSNPTGVANPHDGKGDKYNPLAGIVLGDASVTMDGGTVVRNIYGAGAMGSVGTMTTDENNHLVISSGGKTTIDISGGTVGVDGIVRDDGNSNGNVFGAARGDKDTDQTDVALVKTTEVTISQAEGKTTYVWGNVYGGGETGDVGTYYTITEEGANKGTNAYLGGSGACVVEVTGGTVHHNVFGAGKGESSKYECKKAMVSSTDVTIDTNAKVNGNVYGGGEVGRVEYNTVVKIGSGAGAETGGTSKPEIGGSVYGAGAGLETHGYSALVRGNSTVTVEGNAKVNGNVYGGGEKATVGKYWVSLVAQDPNEAPPSGFPDGMPYKTRDGGICTVNIQGYAQVGPDAGGSENAGHVFGAGKGVEPSYSAGVSKRMKNGNTWETFSGATGEADYLQFLETLALASVTNVTIDGNAKVKGSVYGGSESGFVQDEVYVTINNGEIGTTSTTGTTTTTTYGNIYGGGRGLSNFAEAGRVKGGVTIAVNGGTARGSVYGGGELGIVTGAVLVNINNGIVEKDVYGGGALANTNTNNWNGTTLTETYLEVGGLIAGTSSVVGYYTKSGDNYTILTTGTAVAGTKYYRKVNTTVNLLGGKIYGDAYGGGLGDLAARGTGHSNVAALVYGDVFVTLDGTAFDINKYEGKDIVKSGRVFGCNNLNGSPKGDVTVTVNKTVTTASGVKRTPEDPNNTGRPPMGEGVNVARSYELAAVYGGGNLADYEAEGTGRKTHVIINSCDVSINQVYGGGNAAKVPETDVLVNGAYEIHQVFGGGNGADMYTLDNGASWKMNPGADIDGNANTLMKGGYIHEAYGGSNEKGTITGNITIDTGTGGLAACPVQVDKLVGAGKNADVNGNLIIILGCKDNTKIPIVYGGADNAHVNGNVELTITSGRFGQVFGGNNLGGVIKGHIYLNIEETSDCTPIIIDDLYLGGNQAAYSRYGYYVQTTTTEGEGATGVGAPGEEPVLNADAKLILLPRTSIDDRRKPVNTYTFDEVNNKWTWTLYPETGDDAFKPYEQPVLNVTSCTSIGRVFGGGLGEGAAMYADPTVNINMIPGKHAEDQLGGEHKLGQIGTGYTDTNGQRVEGGVFGGGNEAAVYGNTTVNIGTEKTVKLHLSVVDANTGEYTMSEAKNVEGANILSNVYGGGNEADVTGNTYVNVCAKEADDASTADVIEYKGVTISGTGYEGVTIAGNVFGGGKGIADSFTCAKAMIGKDGDGIDHPEGGTHVTIGNGTVMGNVYGGGEIGRVEKNTVVTIGLADVGSGESAPVIKGNVFGGGMGKETHGYAALVRGNPTVTIQADAKVEHNVYGGGQIASVARYNVPRTEGEVEDAIAQGYDAHLGMPYALANTTSGNCHVTVKDNAIIGPDTPMKMYHSEITDGSDEPDDAGHVFGAGKGILPENYTYVDKEHKPKRMVLRDETIHTDAKKGIDWEYVDPSDDNNKNVWEYFANRDAYIIFIQTLALSSYANVTIGDDTSKPFVKGSVYGGSENGLVQFDTKVYIKSGQIGCGKNTTAPYGDDVWVDGYVPTDDLECASWEYGLDSNNDGKKDLFAPYDPNANASGNLDQYPGGISTEGGRRIATDGHTYYGNVFGGGSGSVPYFDTTEGISKYLSSAGTVKGDTYVEISGGHILTNVYGGCEATNVLGTSKVTMTGGTLGVPRTPQQIKDHPVTCYLFGAGKGDQRIYFNKETNVNDAIVNVEGGRIYGSVFGGGEDGHVLRNTTVTIGKTDGTGPKIGTVGSTYVDGNVFGGGRGFGGEALTAGNVGGSVDLIINGGTMLGSVYGGGRLASVGYGLYLVNEEVGGVKPYGKMREDNEYDGSYPDPSPEAASAFYTKGRGHITVNINGGTIGSDVEDEHSGNVFGGSMGRLTKIDGSPFDDSDHWSLLATAKTTEVKIAGGTIKRNVYGGGEMGTVIEKATVNISGGTIGKAGSDNVEIGNVFGGGKGYLDPAQTYVGAGIVKGNTNVAIQNGTSGSTTTTPTIYQNVYGGGELGYVGMFTTPDHKEYTWTENTGLCTVGVAGGMITGHVFGAGKGHDDTFECERAMVRTTSVAVSDGTVGGNVYGGGEVGRVDQNSAVTIGPATGDSAPTITGSVFGAGAGVETHGYSALVRGNTAVVVQGNAKVGNSVYGGGQIAAVGRYGLDGSGMPSTLVSGGECVVTVQGNAVIGANGIGNVFGAGMGVDESKKTYTYADNANRPKRMMTYASGLYTDANKALWEFSDATHTYVWEYFDTKTKYLNFLQTLALATDTRLTVNGNASVKGSVYGGSESGFVQRDTEVKILGGEILTVKDAAGNITEGNVFGGGKGISDNDAAGRVRSDTRITVLDGTINGDVYGGGALGKANTLSATNTTIVNLLGGTINGDVYGGGLGNATTAADVGNTKVNLNGMTTEELNSFSGDFKTLLTTTLTGLKEFTKKGAVVKGNVFGANNVNGTPKGHVLVHVHGTQNENTTAINAKVDGKYDVTGVYGGGKSSDYVPTDTKQSTEVIIEGCDLTSIYEVYGGGYGAATPATDVLIKGTKIIENVFGGGYGASTAGFTNPGANVGYHTDKSKYDLGTGKALVRLMAGTIKNVYGASNTLGDIRGGSNVTNVANDGSAGCCEKLTVGEIYGGGKKADMFGGAEIILGCMPNDWIGAIYAGAENANVGGDVGLTLTSGKFERVFGGNKSGGKIDGYIEVNIEENPECGTPIIIGELYGGGNEAAYTIPEKYGANYLSPRVNVRAFTSIGTIFGGGLGKTATVTGNPWVNINEVAGGREYAGETRTLEDGTKVTLYERKADGKMGVIGTVFGGGNAAPVIGNPRVEIGTAAKQKMLSLQTKDVDGKVIEVEKDVLGADIRGNVYGGGNNAAVTGDPKVVIGQEK